MPAWMSAEREKAGDQALAALREAERRLTANPEGGALAAAPARLRAGTVRGCVYCGGRSRTNSYPATCRLHSDLPARDPNYEGLG